LTKLSLGKGAFCEQIEEEAELALSVGNVSNFVFLASAYEGGWPVFSLAASSSHQPWTTFGRQHRKPSELSFQLQFYQSITTLINPNTIWGVIIFISSKNSVFSWIQLLFQSSGIISINRTST